ncbi:hypothetical protein PAXRUDRAFT_829253 [Paxillus rubicundulus Ve08.2h10]|uniref:Uncharacterized protein n=1 Tax=Paxillus rubicundulus Ve08.2h10 TaxID=930991 RepID=A0A0D0DN14_9AGAM|nr:hypothetical protein PAXRUDRAFT_829253 [Paxillus rubicundulus Ve08.2h10]
MAQPVFDGHPLEEYLRDSGEASEVMPGGTVEFSLQNYLTPQPYFPTHCERVEELCFTILGAFELLSSLFSPDSMSRRTLAFAERFKYGVISSSLLSPPSTTPPIPHPHRRAFSPSFPGKLASNHSRNPSAAESTLTDNVSLSIPCEPEVPFWPITLSFTVVVAALSARFYFSAFLLLAGTLYYMHVHKLDIRSKLDVMTPSLQALQHLISAGQLWDSMINDTFSILENEEQSIFYGPASPPTPSSSLRVALSTSLLTTQTQCDNVRQLLSAITSPTELAQLSEMYAPPSPMKSTFNSDSQRPLSLPGSRKRTTSLTDRMNKRSTWNGSYAALAHAGNPPVFQLTQRRDKRRSDLSTLLCTTTSPTPIEKPSRSMPATPSQPLADVSEEEASMVTADSSFAGGEDDESFGAAALSLHRKRVSGGVQTFGLSHRSAPASLTRGNSWKRRTTMSPASKYTRMQTTRHPLSLSALHQSLQSALASKRFACSHLLALRFEDHEDEVYWEDVRSVMSLLTSTLVDASSRLSEVLEELEEQQLGMDDSASESVSGIHTPSSLASPPPARTIVLSQTIDHIVSFAPTPSHLTRFAAHVDAISSALTDAREQLEQCVTLLKEERIIHSPAHSPRSSMSTSAGGENGAGTGAGETSEHPAIQAYERLRRELGLALRECQRGRERLISIVTPSTPPTDDIDDDLPVLGPDSNGSDKVDVQKHPGVTPTPPVELCSDGDVSLAVVSSDGETVYPDDVTSHLLLTTSVQHLLSPGIEQVFEADTGGVGTFTRERTKLSREERIQLAKAHRESAGRPGHERFPDSPSLKMERWGPGGEVVQELKDVIWKVGERRRKLTESA